MVVFTNARLGASAELIVSDEVAAAMLFATAEAASRAAEARWEHELVRWLETRGRVCDRVSALDVGDIAWTPDHFEAQRRFLIDAIVRGSLGSEHGAALERWRRMIEAHPRDSVQVGRRWQWEATA
ncbi:MAG TPA: hypothetical protein VGG28_15685 [Kofleriaceae bacterium]